MSIPTIKEESFKPFRLNKDTFPKFGIHKLRVPEKEIKIISKEQKKSHLAALSSWIDQYMFKDGQPKMGFVERRFDDNSWWSAFKNHGFHLKIFHSTSQKVNNLCRFFWTFRGDGDHTDKANHYLFFFYRQLIKAEKVGTTGVVDIVVQTPASEVFVLTKGNGWQALKRRDFQFPISTIRRFADPKITEQRFKDFTGNSTARKESKGFLPSLTENLYQLTTYIHSVLKKRAFIRFLPPLQTQKKPTKATIGVEMGQGFVKLGRRLTLPGYADLLNYFSQIYSGQNHPRLESKKNKLSKTRREIDDPHFDFLDLIQPVDYSLKTQLENYRKDFLWDLFNGGKMPYLHFSHKFSNDLYTSSITPTFKSEYLLDDPFYWDFPPTLEEVLETLKSRGEFQNLENKEAFFKLIGQVELSFFKGSRLLTGKLLEFVEGEIKTDDHKTYFYISGIWLEASAEYHVLLQREFNQFIKTHLVKPGQLEYLPRPWMCNKKWASFTLDDIKERLTDKTRANELIKKLKAKKLCKQIKETKKFLVEKHADLIGMNYPEKELINLENFLNEKADFLATHKNEGPYNEEYLYDVINNGTLFGPEEGWLPGDRIDHTARKIELFDVIRYTKDAVILFHVKENFGGPTGIALNQLEYSAKQLQQVRQGNSSSNAIEEFWNEVMNSKQKGYRETLKKQLVALGKENFLKIFKRPRIVFVYAFIDGKGENERLLEDEHILLEKIQFTPEEFNAPECLNYKKQANTTPLEIFQLLEEQKYLKKGRPTDKLLLCPEKRFFLHTKLRKKTQNPAIYKILKDKIKQSVSAYDSTGAKARLFSFKRELEKLGITGAEFKICQIPRPKSAQGFKEDRSNQRVNIIDTVSSNTNVQFRESRDFTFIGMRYERKTTEGDGSCALHALLGTESNGKFIYQSGRHKGRQAKLDFLKALETTKDQTILQLHRENLLSLLDESQRENGNSYVKMIFNDPKVVALNQKRILEGNNLEKQLSDRANKEALFWKSLIEPDEKIGQLLSNALSANGRTFSKDIDLKSLISWINEDRDNYVKLLSKDSIKKYQKIRNEIGDIQETRDTLKTNFLLSPDVWNSYQKIFVKSEYYLTTQELKIAAYLFDKRVTVLRYDRDKNIQRAEQDFNHKQNIDHVTIFHEGIHFERCIQTSKK